MTENFLHIFLSPSMKKRYEINSILTTCMLISVQQSIFVSLSIAMETTRKHNMVHNFGISKIIIAHHFPLWYVLTDSCPVLEGQMQYSIICTNKGNNTCKYKNAYNVLSADPQKYIICVFKIQVVINAYLILFQISSSLPQLIIVMCCIMRI